MGVIIGLGIRRVIYTALEGFGLRYYSRERGKPHHKITKQEMRTKMTSLAFPMCTLSFGSIKILSHGRPLLCLQLHRNMFFCSSIVRSLPSTLGQLLLLRQLVAVDTNHGLSQTRADLSEHLGIVEVCRGLNNGLCPLCRITRLEDS